MVIFHSYVSLPEGNLYHISQFIYSYVSLISTLESLVTVLDWRLSVEELLHRNWLYLDLQYKVGIPNDS